MHTKNDSHTFKTIRLRSEVQMLHCYFGKTSVKYELKLVTYFSRWSQFSCAELLPFKNAIQSISLVGRVGVKYISCNK